MSINLPPITHFRSYKNIISRRRPIVKAALWETDCRYLTHFLRCLKSHYFFLSDTEELKNFPTSNGFQNRLINKFRSKPLIGVLLFNVFPCLNINDLVAMEKVKNLNITSPKRIFQVKIISDADEKEVFFLSLRNSVAYLYEISHTMKLICSVG